jgi:hypothetical protein
VALVDQILSGAADALCGRVVYAGDNLTDLAGRAATNPALRRLRVQSDPQ